MIKLMSRLEKNYILEFEQIVQRMLTTTKLFIALAKTRSQKISRFKLHPAEGTASLIKIIWTIRTMQLVTHFPDFLLWENRIAYFK